LLAKKTVVVVAAVQADVVEDAALPGEGDFVAVRPCTTLTPGVSVSRSSNLRPRIGVVAIVRSSSVEAADVRVVSTVGAPLTVTVSATFETSRRGSSSPSGDRQQHVFLPQRFEARERQRDAVAARGSWRTAKCPLVSVCGAVRFVSTFLISTDTPGSSAPVGSATVP